MDIQSLLCTNTYSCNHLMNTPPSSSTIHDKRDLVGDYTLSSSHVNASSKAVPTVDCHQSITLSIPENASVSSSTFTGITNPTDPLAFAKFSISSLSKDHQPSQQQTRTPWTSKEDVLLKKGYLQGLSWAMISAKYLPHRSRGCCWGRFRTLQTKSIEKKGWSDVEDRLLLTAIKKHTRLFKQAWRSVSLDMDQTRDWKECEIRSTRIKLHNSVFDTEQQ
ncbi:hypothetical protein BDF20DRAFT_891859 [Mycotypha africana]|uniref:uncharacterized protein n=1 Tax=Mycotypha africana TaxID=64632 RepID=UPI0023012D80|nr:uncharacterized protein BDF20DRAFT_891859 [Mycotypha africana]KAI8968863.1 hypothetical protein BDF20DRAFT_891859 [Mycotypha africana]